MCAHRFVHSVLVPLVHVCRPLALVCMHRLRLGPLLADCLLQEMPAHVSVAMAASSKHSSGSTPGGVAKGTPQRPSSVAAEGGRSSKAAAYGPAAVMGPIVHGLPPTPVLQQQQQKQQQQQQARRGKGGGAWEGSGMWAGGGGALGLSPLLPTTLAPLDFGQAIEGDGVPGAVQAPPMLREQGMSGDGRAQLLPAERRRDEQRVEGVRVEEEQGLQQGARGLRQPPLPPRSERGADVQGSQTHDLGLLDLANDEGFGAGLGDVGAPDQATGGFRGGGSGKWSIGDVSAMKVLRDGSPGPGRGPTGAFDDPDLALTPMNLFK